MDLKEFEKKIGVSISRRMELFEFMGEFMGEVEEKRGDLNTIWDASEKILELPKRERRVVIMNLICALLDFGEVEEEDGEVIGYV
jgi:hypothetical protein